MSETIAERLTPEREAEIGMRLAALPAGEWSAATGLPFNVVSTATAGWTPGREGCYDDLEEQAALDAEARFMGHAPADLRALLAEVQGLRLEASLWRLVARRAATEAGTELGDMALGAWVRGLASGCGSATKPQRSRNASGATVKAAPLTGDV